MEKVRGSNPSGAIKRIGTARLGRQDSETRTTLRAYRGRAKRARNREAKLGERARDRSFACFLRTYVVRIFYFYFYFCLEEIYF